VRTILRRMNLLFDKFLFVSTAICSILFFVVIIIAVVTRYLLKFPILASIELSSLLFIWSCFLAAAQTYRRQAHIRFSLLFEKLNPQLQRPVAITTHLLVIGFLIIVFYQSLLINSLLWRTDLPMLEISQSWFYVPLPIISLIMTAYTIEFILEELHPSNEKAS